MNFIIWVDDIHRGGDFELLTPAINTLVKIYGKLNVLGIVAPQNVNIGKFPKLKKKNLKKYNYDFVLVVGKNVNFSSVLKEAKMLGMNIDKFALDRTVIVPSFTFEKYNELKNSKLSILSMNCFGGMLYHRLGLPFLSPTINMFTTDQDFLSFLKNPAENVESNFELVKTEFNPALNIEYPVFKIGGCTWNMNHYSDFEFAKQKWIERTQRINWKNLLVTMYTENPDILEEFDKLPFEKKVCFVPFETDLDSGYYIDLNKLNNPELWQAVNGIASGRVPFYDMWDMLLYGKKTSLIEQ